MSDRIGGRVLRALWRASGAGLLIVAAAMPCRGAQAGSAGAVEPQAILAASDLIRNPQKPFGLSLLLVEYRDGRELDSNTLEVYSKLDAATGQFGTLVSYVGPPRDAGKLVLENGTDMWFYDPSSEASIRISPEQRLLDQASTGDVVSVNFAHDYRASLAATDDILDGDRKLRHCYALELRPVAPNATYHRIEMWIDRASHRPVRGRFYSESDRLLKTAYYRKYERELGVERPTEIVIIDGLTPSWVTVMRYSHYAWRDVPDSWLQRDYLPRFRPE